MSKSAMPPTHRCAGLTALLAASVLVATHGCDLREATKVDYSAGGAGGTGGTPGTGGSAPAYPTLVSGLADPWAIGMSQETHLIHAEGYYWLFYLDPRSLTTIDIRYSSDFVTWMDAPPIETWFPHQEDGRTFSVAHRSVNGDAVVHIPITVASGNARQRFHLRGLVEAEPTPAIIFDTAQQVFEIVEAGLADVDVPAAAIAASADLNQSRPFVATGFQDPPTTGYCWAWWAVVPDAGKPSPPPWTTTWAYSTMDTGTFDWVDSRAAIPLDIDKVLLLWQDADGFIPLALRSCMSTPSSQDCAAPPIFELSSPNDWNMTMVEGTVHAVRGLAGNFLHDTYDFTHKPLSVEWSNTPDEPPYFDAKSGSGLVVNGLGDTLLLVTIANDDSVMGVRLTGDVWGEWFVVVEPSNVARDHLAGMRTSVDGRATVIWMEQRSDGYAIAGTQLDILGP